MLGTKHMKMSQHYAKAATELFDRGDQ
jgi:hypothetical protein